MDGYGNTIIVQHDKRLFSLYAHLKKSTVKKGERVEPGDYLGTVGRTAGTRAEPKKQFVRSGAHLHFEFLDRWPPRGRDRDRLDPGPVFRFLGIIVPEKGELIAATDSPASCATPAVFPPGPLPGSVPIGTVARAGGTAAIGLILLLSAFSGSKKKSRPLV